MRLSKILTFIVMTALIIILVLGCSTKSQYEKEFLRIYGEYLYNTGELFETVDYYKENPSNAPEYFNDDWVLEAYYMFMADMIGELDKLEVPDEYKDFHTYFLLSYIYEYNCKDAEGKLCDEYRQKSQELLDTAYSYNHPTTKE